jgi:uncharacterized membrane protein YoaK (UPF0700 family)
MTTNITQLTIDLATLAQVRGDSENLARARRRAGMTLPCVVGFASGCAAGALLEVCFGLWALVLPVVLAALAIPLGELRSDGEASLEFKNGGSHDERPTTARPTHECPLG